MSPLHFKNLLTTDFPAYVNNFLQAKIFFGEMKTFVKKSLRREFIKSSEMPQLPLQRASRMIINFHQAYQYWRPQLSSCQVDRGLELTLSRSLERRNHGPSSWLSHKWKNKRRKSKNKNGWNIRKRREARGWGYRGPHRVRTRPKTPTALYPLRHPWQPCRLEVPLSRSANQSCRLTLYLRDVVPDAAAPAAAWHSPPAPHLAGLGGTY